MMWSSDIEVEVRTYALNYIDICVGDYIQGGWRFTGIYGFSEEERKKDTAQLMETLHGECDLPWLCGGDFNLMLTGDEKKGGNDFKQNEANIFRSAIDRCGLEDMGYMGYEFTWSNNRGDEENIQERLDRFLANRTWRMAFPGSFVSHLTKRNLDHLPILLTLKGCPKVKKPKRRRKLFRFEEMWMREEESTEVIEEAWKEGASVKEKLKRTTSSLMKWSKGKFGNHAREIRECKNKMSKLIVEPQTDEVIARIRALDDHMDELDSREELYWKQRSRQAWLKDGEKNTMFFHIKAMQ